MIFELITGDYLIDPKGSEDYSKEDDHLAYCHELMGEPDEDYILSGT